MIKLLVISGLIVAIISAIITYNIVSKGGSKKKAPAKKTPIKKSVKKKVSNKSIEDMIAIVRNVKSSRKDIDDSLDYVVKYLPFPSKRGIAIPNETSRYFQYVFSYCKNSKVDAKRMVRGVLRLKQANPGYTRELDDIESKAVAARSGQ